MVHSFLAELVLEVDLVSGLDKVTMVGLKTDRRVFLVHSLLSICDNFYSTQRHIFVCLVDMPAKGLHPVVEIPVEAFIAQSSVRAVS